MCRFVDLGSVKYVTEVFVQPRPDNYPGKRSACTPLKYGNLLESIHDCPTVSSLNCMKPSRIPDTMCCFPANPSTEEAANLEIRVGMTRPNTTIPPNKSRNDVCATGLYPNGTTQNFTVVCPPALFGRYVSIQRIGVKATDPAYLTLCEVQVSSLGFIKALALSCCQTTGVLNCHLIP